MPTCKPRARVCPHQIDRRAAGSRRALAPGEIADGQAEVADKLPECHLPLRGKEAQYVRRMDGNDDARGRFPVDHPAPEGTDPGIATEDGARRGGAKANDERRGKCHQLAVEPAAAGVELALRGSLVDPPLAARRPLEVLDRVGDIDLA